jgi:hypothetical protein
MILDLKEISGRSFNQIVPILGKPDQTEPLKPSNVPVDISQSQKFSFKERKIEIVFIDGIADWITINDPAIPFEVESLIELGLDLEPPSFKTHYIMRWKNLNPFTEITFFSRTQNIVDYILVKSFQN